MGVYSKSIVAFIGLLAVLSKEVFGVEIGSETVDSIVSGILALGTVFAVYRVPNE